MKTVLAMLLFCGVAFGQECVYHRDQGVLLPDPHCTPGAIRTTDPKQICDSTFRTAPFRHTTHGTKVAVCKEYGVKDCPHDSILEIDHLVPLELGGLDDIKDLWPQPATPAVSGFHVKDVLENYLRHAVCIDKSMKLADAQACIMSNWWACYQKVGLDKREK
jgi:hypothetical protein